MKEYVMVIKGQEREGLTAGKIYKLIDTRMGYRELYQIIDDYGDSSFYWAYRFKEISELEAKIIEVLE